MFHWDDDPDLNITPLVDVMLVLMSILMITAPSITYEEQISLPHGSKSKPMRQIKPITIRMDKKKNIYLNKDKYSLSNFADTFKLKSQNYNQNSDVFILADKDLDYGSVMRLLRIVKRAGFAKASLITE